MGLLSYLWIACLCASLANTVKYKPTWESLDSRPLPSWYDEAKVGIFLHWGVFSVPAFESALFWDYWQHEKRPDFIEFMKKNYRPNFTYADFAPMFKAEFFDPGRWADIFKAAGARYVVLVSKHCEGFSNWPSKYNFNWNSMDVGPKRDLVGELAEAVRRKFNLRFGIYHSLIDSFNPLWLADKANNFTTQNFVKEKSMPELYELINNYQPEIVWSDAYFGGSSNYWDAKNFLTWLYNESPVKDFVVTNDRWGPDTMCKHGGFLTCSDRYNPGKILSRKWESCNTLDRKAWTCRKNMTFNDVLSMEELLTGLVRTVSYGGNYLLNVGPNADGTINPIFEERLQELGDWLSVNGEAIYSSKPWHTPQDTMNKDVWYTTNRGLSGTELFATVLSWPKNGTLTLSSPIPGPSTTIEMLGIPGYKFKYSVPKSGALDIMIPNINYRELPSVYAWVFKFKNLKNV